MKVQIDQDVKNESRGFGYSGPDKPNANDAQWLSDQLSDQDRQYKRESGNYVTTQSLFHRADNLGGAGAYRKNYLSFLEMAWGSHLSIRLTPDTFWYTLLCELAAIVKADPEKFRPLFSESEEKQNVIIITAEMVTMPLDDLVVALKTLVPTDTDQFIPEFSTTTPRAKYAFNASFCDMVSPYYNYFMLLCGIPAIEVMGTKEDWQALRGHWGFMSETVLKDDQEYWGRVDSILGQILDGWDEPDVDFWSDMFHMEFCGSGSDVEVRGWFAKLYKSPPDGTPKVCNFPTHVSVVKYTQLDTQKNYEMKVGLFQSTMEDGFLTPEFAHVVYEKTAPVVSAEGREEPQITVIEAPADRGNLGEVLLRFAPDIELGDAIINEKAIKAIKLNDEEE